MTKPLRVLLVEDEALILMQLEALIEEAGHLVVGTAMRCAEAIDLAFAVHPDIAFVDVSLGDGGSGLEVAQALRALNDLMIVFVTADPVRLGGDLAGAAGIISKPFSRAALARGMSYLEECVRRPPPISSLPRGMEMASRFCRFESRPHK